MNAAKLVQRKDWPWKQCPLAYESITITEYDHEKHELKCHAATRIANRCPNLPSKRSMSPHGSVPAAGIHIRFGHTFVCHEPRLEPKEKAPVWSPCWLKLLPERPVILIAGAADTGLLALVARATSSDAEITVLDRCDTPLEMC